MRYYPRISALQKLGRLMSRVLFINVICNFGNAFFLYLSAGVDAQSNILALGTPVCKFVLPSDDFVVDDLRRFNDRVICLAKDTHQLHPPSRRRSHSKNCNRGPYRTTRHSSNPPPTSKRRKAGRSSRDSIRTQPSATKANRSEADRFTGASKGFSFSRTSCWVESWASIGRFLIRSSNRQKQRPKSKNCA